MKIDFSHSTTKTGLRALFTLLKKILNEKQYRLVLGGFVVYVLGCVRGSITWLSEITDTSRDTIRKGRGEIQREDPHMFSERVRRPGAGRKRTEEHHPEIEGALKEIVERESYGNPQNVKGRIYCAMSLRKIRSVLRGS